MSDPNSIAAARSAVTAIASQVGVKLSAVEVETAAALVLGIVDLATGQALKRAAAAGRAAAAQVTTVEQANAVLEAAAASVGMAGLKGEP